MGRGMIETMGLFVIVGGFIFLAGILCVYIDFVCWMVSGERYFARFQRIVDKLLIGLVVIGLTIDSQASNDCCGDWSMLAPAHRLSLYALVLACVVAYIYSTIRKRLAPPLAEVVVNCLLLVAIPLIILIAIQGGYWQIWILCAIPLCMLAIMTLADNHQLALASIGEAGEGESRAIEICRYLLYLPGWQKLPVLIVLCLPVLVSLIAILLLFGQKPDSLVRAFTDTYKHHLSQLNIDCSNVRCGGHFLCSVAAKGHPNFVRPVRRGVRAGEPILCNRQLLVSNAFEELLEQHWPRLHRPVRQLYNHVGKFVHRYYGVFDNVWVSDVVYVLMKPLEWVFVFTLYLFDRNPENRIARQYLPKNQLP